MKTPTKKDLTALIIAVKKSISPEYRASYEDDTPGIQLTIGWTPETGEWNYQTGDNSYTGGAYLHPVWAVVAVYKSSNARELAADIINQLLEQTQ